MDFDFFNIDSSEFDIETYIRMLIAIAKADKDNGPAEFSYVRKKALALGVDYDLFLETTDKDYQLAKKRVSRLTAFMILTDAIVLASMDRNFSLPERQRVYNYAQNLDIPRKDVDELETIVQGFRRLNRQWQSLVKAA